MINENNDRLMNILLDNIDYAEYNLNEDEKKWIYMFINESPDTLIDLDTDLQSITEDRHIEIENIPTIIKIIADAYFFAASNFEKFKEDHLFVFITYTVVVVLDSEILILPINVKKEDLFNIIDSSMALLNMNLNTSGNNNFDDEIDFYKKYCGCGCGCGCGYGCFYYFNLIKNLLRKQLKSISPF
jgi:hypothetical protein